MSGCRSTPFAADYELLRKVKVGMSEQEVRSILGVPQHEYEGATAPTPYYVKGWAYKERPITNKVLIYIRSEPIAYVWIDQNGRVEDVFVGGS
jgi:outer membrane protein assembly factor BamE (lipoprotein component of BamABCDE complex)